MPKRYLGFLVISALIALMDHGITQSNDPVTVELTSPTNGAVVSGTIQLEAFASSTEAPIAYVDFYRDGVFLKRVYNSAAMGKVEMGIRPGP